MKQRTENPHRKDFPLLAANDGAYLDNAATTQRPACVLEAERKLYEKQMPTRYGDSMRWGWRLRML